jgi:regulator of protease activity HflC (stomatin/prohibitin superfamily)
VGAAIGWVGDLVQAILKFFPRLVLVRETHRGVKFGRRGGATMMLPGLRWWWPLISDVEVVPVARQSIDLPPQTLVTKDDVSVTASAVVVYEIRDAVKAYTTSWDFDSTISDVARVAFRDYIVGQDFEAMRSNPTKSDQTLVGLLRGALRPYGVGVLSVGITDLVPTRALSIFMPDRQNAKQVFG